MGKPKLTEEQNFWTKKYCIDGYLSSLQGAIGSAKAEIQEANNYEDLEKIIIGLIEVLGIANESLSKINIGEQIKEHQK